MITTKYKFTNGKTQTVSVKNNATVQDILTKTGIDATGYSVKVNGKPADATTEVTATTLVTFASKIKGGKVRTLDFGNKRRCELFYNGKSPFLVKA